MIVRKPGYQESFSLDGRALAVPDHTLFTGKLAGPYVLPRFTTGPGIFTMPAGSARCTLKTLKRRDADLVWNVLPFFLFFY